MLDAVDCLLESGAEIMANDSFGFGPLLFCFITLKLRVE